MAGRSESVIVQASHILLVRLDSVVAGAWTRADQRTRAREVDLRARVEESLKGRVSGAVVDVRVAQREPALPRTFAVPGVWSGQELRAGASFLVFSSSASEDLAAVLDESAILKVLDPEGALEEVRLAMQAERNGSTLRSLVASARERLPSPTPLFALYLSARLEDAYFGDVEAFGDVLDYLESAGLSPRFRGVVLSRMYSRLTRSDPAPIEFVRGLVLSTFRILDRPESASLEAQLIGVDLPNLLGLEGGGTPKDPDSIFRGHAAERGEAERILRDTSVPAGARILEWMRGRQEGPQALGPGTQAT